MPPSRWVIVTCTTAFSWREAWKSLCFNLKIFWPGDWGGLGPLGPPCLRQCAQYTLQRLHSELSHARVRVHCCPVFSWQFTRLKCDIQSDRHATYALSNDNIMSHKLTRYMKVTGESAKKWNKIGGSTHTADCFPSHHPSPLHSFSFILDRRRAGRGSRGPGPPPPPSRVALLGSEWGVGVYMHHGFHGVHVFSVRFAGGWRGLTLHWLRMTPTLVTENCGQASIPDHAATPIQHLDDIELLQDIWYSSRLQSLLNLLYSESKLVEHLIGPVTINLSRKSSTRVGGCMAQCI